MPVPQQPIPHRGPRLLPLLALSLLLALTAHAADQPRRIPLDPLGFQPLSPQYLLAGSSMLTLHYVDDTHLLITFHVRRLMHRLPDDPPEDQDRNIDALLLELPTGRILARTSWRTHDHSQYLWSIGHGRFLLRIRDTITLIAPLANLPTGEPFREHPFLNTHDRRIAEISVSPDYHLLTVETVKRTPPTPRPKTPLFGPTPPPPPEPLTLVQINFYRLPEPAAHSETAPLTQIGKTGERKEPKELNPAEPGKSTEPSKPAEAADTLRPQYAGVLHTHTIGTIAALSAGYIAVLDQGRQHWAFDFNAYSGKKLELAAFDSVCRPSPFFVSRSEFIAFGCRTGTNRQLLGGFNLRGEETWQQNLFGDYVSPSLVFAPQRDRFAFSRVLLHTAATPEQPLLPEEIAAQSVTVFQAGSGKQLLHAECSPAEPAGQNFALSPDGLNLALVHDNAIEIYPLPELTPKEDSDIKLLAASAPEDTTLPVHFQPEPQSLAESTENPDATPDTNPAANPPIGANASESSTAAPENVTPDSLTPVATASAASKPAAQPIPSATPTQGDPDPTQPRKPPTLYTLPTDLPHTPQNTEPK